MAGSEVAGFALQSFVLSPLSRNTTALQGGWVGPVERNGPTQPTYDSVTPELGHLADPHGCQQDFPDLQLEHVPDDNVHGLAHLLAVIYHRPLLVAFHGTEMEGHLATKKVDRWSRHTSHSPAEVTQPSPALMAVLRGQLTQPQ